ncbi:MAG TPA: D-sedoheptulose 7-phosphate isomerase [Bacteroidales bacterium]|nr:D-sedoheptulose 7-phosphate isomerase [Bacteroidales bacterium]HPT10779.1 D-sedoheptulose 7-phosphate isomerase [Bacteroidales bacterium]
MRVVEVIKESIGIREKILGDKDLLQEIRDIAQVCSETFCEGNKVLFCGNGGSAADAQHLAAEFSGRFYYDRPPLPSEALHVNTSFLTAVANDYSFNEVYARLLAGTGDEGDVLIALSTSGRSKNIIKALQKANELGMITIGFTGSGGGEMNALCDYLIAVPSEDTPRIQEIHIMIGHIICEMVESNLFPKQG